MSEEVRDNMRIVWDAPIEMSDGIVLRADVFRPVGESTIPAILSYGPYAKGMSFAESRPFAWQRLIKTHPVAMAATSNKYQAWELPDPENWVKDGYAIVRVDARGAGRSPGYMDPWSPRETQDIYECLAWLAAQPWCNGKVGMSGISYYAMNQYQVAALQPPNLCAICAWEGAGDHYRDATYHGGIFSEFMTNWYPRAALTMQHGVGSRGMRSPLTGELVAGPETLLPEELMRNRSDIVKRALEHPLDDQYHRDRSPDWRKVTVPMLSAANWGGQGLHTRGNFEAYRHAASSEKWLEAHGDTHWTEFYSSYGVDLQKRFFGYFLKGEDTGWDRQPRVLLNIRHPGGKMVPRAESEWPLERTRWTRFYLHPEHCSLGEQPLTRSAEVSFAATGDGITFKTPPLSEALEITGPLAAKLLVSSSTTDADLFLVLRVFAPDGSEVVFQGAQIHAPRWDKAGFAPHTASSTPLAACLTSRITRTTSCGHWRPASPSSWMWRSGRRASPYRPAIRSGCRCVDVTIASTALRSIRQAFLIRRPVSDHSCTRNPSIVRRTSSVARRPCISMASGHHSYYCRSFRRADSDAKAV